MTGCASAGQALSSDATMTSARTGVRIARAYIVASTVNPESDEDRKVVMNRRAAAVTRV
jgi:hypothetical protein